MISVKGTIKNGVALPEFVLIEFGNALSSVEFRERASLLIHGLRSSSLVEVVPSSTDLFDLGFVLYRERPDKAWSLVDCTVL